MKRRLEYIDNAKGLLIIMMVCGHVFLTGPVRQFIYTFHMPAFLIISGILSNYSFPNSFLRFLKSRIYSLIIPFCFFEAIGVVTDIICNGVTLNIKGYIYNTLTLNCNNGADGFLIHMFGAEIIFFLIQKVCKKDNIKIASGLILMLIAFALPADFRWEVRLMVIYCGFKIIGFYFYKNEVFKKGFSVIAFIFTFLVSCIGLYVDNTYGNLINAIIYVFGALVGTYFILAVSKSIHFKPLEYIGKNSLIILGTHNLFLLPLRAYVMPDFSVQFGIFAFIIIICVEFPVIYLCNRFVPFLVGKKFQPNKYK